MRFTRYSKFNGLDVYGINLGDLMEGLSDSLLYSGYDDDYYWTRERMPQDTSLDALRRALLQALVDQELLSQHQIQQMLDENEGKYEGSQLQEMLNQLIERLVEEGYLKLHEEPQSENRGMMGQGEGRVEEPLIFVTELVAFFEVEGSVQPEGHVMKEGAELVMTCQSAGSGGLCQVRLR